MTRRVGTNTITVPSGMVNGEIPLRGFSSFDPVETPDGTFFLTEMKVIGIDPGMKGGLCLIGDSGISAISMPQTPVDIIDQLKLWHSNGIDGFAIFAYIEDVPKFAGSAVPSSTAAVLHKNFGWCEMALVAAGIPYELVRPQVWQKELGLGNKKEAGSPSKWKNKLKSKAQALYPNVKITLDTCDAVLIAHYGLTR